MVQVGVIVFSPNEKYVFKIVRVTCKNEIIIYPNRAHFFIVTNTGFIPAFIYQLIFINRFIKD